MCLIGTRLAAWGSSGSTTLSALGHGVHQFWLMEQPISRPGTTSTHWMPTVALCVGSTIPAAKIFSVRTQLWRMESSTLVCSIPAYLLLMQQLALHCGTIPL